MATPIDSIIRQRKNFALLISLAVVGSLYFFINRPWGTIHHIDLPADRDIPLLPIFVIPYLLYFPLLGGTIAYFCMQGRNFAKVAYTFLLTWTISYLVYFCFQTTIVRPEIQGEGILLSLLREIYNRDAAYNCFPSLHASNAVICALCTHMFACRAQIWVIPLAISIAASTVFVKQHYIMDTLAGLILGTVIFCLVCRFHESEQSNNLRSHNS